jgi:hypothetical protein
MIYLLSIVLTATLVGIAHKARERGLITELRDLVVAAGAGLLAGIFIGIGARIGMSAIAFANGEFPKVTIPGSLNVIITFSCFGIVLGIIYEGLFRELLWQSGLIYGLLITICVTYPLADSAAQVLNFQPPVISLVISTVILTAVMWLPFGISLEALLSRWHRRIERATSHLPPEEVIRGAN